MRQDLPEVVVNRAVAVGAQAWLDGLGDLVAQLERDWQIEIGPAYQGGSEAFVAPATLADGSEAVAKLTIPRPGNAAQHEARVLELANGEGCARLLRSDVAREALLLEKLGPSLNDLGVPFAERQEILCATAMRVWRPAAGFGFPTGAEKGQWLIDFVTTQWEALDRPCSERAVNYAIGCARRRIAAHDDERSVLVHGDVHEWNALQSGDGFKLIDPDGLLAEAEYDLGILIREDPLELLQGDPRARSRRLAQRSGLDEVAIWEWGAIERVSTGLMCTQIDLQPVGRQMLEAADRVATLG